MLTESFLFVLYLFAVNGSKISTVDLNHDPISVSNVSDEPERRLTEISNNSTRPLLSADDELQINVNENSAQLDIDLEEYKFQSMKSDRRKYQLYRLPFSVKEDFNDDLTIDSMNAQGEYILDDVLDALNKLEKENNESMESEKKILPSRKVRHSPPKELDIWLSSEVIESLTAPHKRVQYAEKEYQLSDKYEGKNYEGEKGRSKSKVVGGDLKFTKINVFTPITENKKKWKFNLNGAVENNTIHKKTEIKVGNVTESRNLVRDGYLYHRTTQIADKGLNRRQEKDEEERTLFEEYVNTKEKYASHRARELGIRNFRFNKSENKKIKTPVFHYIFNKTSIAGEYNINHREKTKGLESSLTGRKENINKKINLKFAASDNSFSSETDQLILRTSENDKHKRLRRNLPTRTNSFKKSNYDVIGYRNRCKNPIIISNLDISTATFNYAVNKWKELPDDCLEHWTAREIVKPKTFRPKTVKQETDRPETVKQETIRQETVKQETVRPETVKQETDRPETVKPKTVRPEIVKQETIRQETVKLETVRPETVKQETVRPEIVKLETVRLLSRNQLSIESSLASKNYRKHRATEKLIQPSNGFLVPVKRRQSQLEGVRKRRKRQIQPTFSENKNREATSIESAIIQFKVIDTPHRRCPKGKKRINGKCRRIFSRGSHSD